MWMLCKYNKMGMVVEKITCKYVKLTQLTEMGFEIRFTTLGG